MLVFLVIGSPPKSCPFLSQRRPKNAQTLSQVGINCESKLFIKKELLHTSGTRPIHIDCQRGSRFRLKLPVFAKL